MVGPSESGKSILARRIYLSAQAPRLVIDPSDSEICDVPGTATFRDPSRFDPAWPMARFVPADPGDMDAYDECYRLVRYYGGPRYVWVDEAGLVLPAAGTPKWARAVVVQGRKAELGHLALHTRIVEIYKQLKSVLAHLIIFGILDPEDLQTAARIIGISTDELQAALAALPEFGFLWWQRVEKRILVCPPLVL
ncbi:MAG: hypothetical protein ACYCVN_12405 [Acidimicrobiales bacterium]